jgi:anaerobic magnesium-protoporphyrin IX monomethyl ester cyclase
LTSSLKTAGHEVFVIDLNNQFRTPEDVVRVIGEQKPQFVGLSVKSATFANAVELHRLIVKDHPEITFVYGGPHVSLAKPSVLDEAPEAYFLKGDAEYTLRDFVTRHAAGERSFADVPGMMYRDASGTVHNSSPRSHTREDLDDMPLPDFESFDSRPNLKLYPLLTSRGCPYKCTYCSVPAISGSKWIYRSAESVVRELDHVKNTLGLDRFVMVDDNFTIHKRRTEAICQAIIERQYNFIWSCGNGIRADRIWSDTAAMMFEAGCREVAFGIESLDPEVFARLVKGEEIDHIRHGISVVQEAGIKVTGFFMIGLPGSTYKKDLRTLAGARRLGLDNYFFGLTIPYPGTDMWDWAQKNARFLVPWQSSYHISEVFREGLDRVKVEPVFDTPEYPAAARKKLFGIAQASKTRIKASRLRAVERRLQAKPEVPVVVLRSSRRTTVFEICSRIAPASKHVILWKGSPAFLEQIEKPVRASYDVVEIPGEGFVTAADAEKPQLAHLRGAVVIIDIPGGATETYQNVIDFARALKPWKLVAFHGSDVELVPLDRFEPLTGRKTTSVVRPIPSAVRRPAPAEDVEAPKSNVFWLREVEAPATIQIQRADA